MQLAAQLDRPGYPSGSRSSHVITTTATSTGVPCRDNDSELWFADRPVDVELAKSLCGTCPARQGCLAGALDRHEPWGVWGGELFEGGIVVPRKRPRGRPRKDDPRYLDDPRFVGPQRTTNGEDAA